MGNKIIITFEDGNIYITSNEMEYKEFTDESSYLNINDEKYDKAVDTIDDICKEIRINLIELDNILHN